MIVHVTWVNAPALDPTDEEGLVKSTMEWLLRHRQTKGAETDKWIPNGAGSQSFTLSFLLLMAYPLWVGLISANIKSNQIRRFFSIL